MLVEAPPPRLTAAQKAAIILASLEPEAASLALQAISDRHIEVFVEAIRQLKSVPASLRQHIAIEFISEVHRRKNELAGGLDEARRILAALKDPERINRLLNGAPPGPDKGADIWKRVEAAPEEALGVYLASLRPEAAALIARQLSIEKIAKLLSAAEPAFARRLMAALAREPLSEPDAILALAEAVEAEFLRPLSAAPRRGNISELANEVLSMLPKACREDLVSHLAAEDPEAGAEIKKALVVFETLPEKLDETGAATLVRSLDRETLIRALVHGKNNAPATVNFLLSNVSKRMAEQYQEEIVSFGEVSEAEGEAAQRNICNEVCRMIRAGQITAKDKFRPRAT